GAELAADLGRGVRLGVHRVNVAGAALHPEEDAAGGLRRDAGLGGAEVLQPQEGGKAQAEDRQAADAQGSKPAEAGAGPRFTAEEMEHGGRPLNRRDGWWWEGGAGGGPPLPLD